MLGTILVCILPILAIVGGIGGMHWLKKEECEFDGWSIGLTLVGFILVISLAVPIYAYSEMIALPYQYQASINTFEETKELLMKYDNITVQRGIEGQLGTIGQGLESQWLKQTLNEAINMKNTLWAQIKACQMNPWQPFRYLLSEINI